MPPPVRRLGVSTAMKRGTVPAKPAAPQRKPPTSRTQETGRAMTSTTVSDRQGPYHESSSEDTVLTREFADNEPIAQVKVGAGLTLNLGNFESLRIDCHVTIPCSRDDLDEAYDTASQFVSDKIQQEQSSWLGKGNEKGKR